MTETAAFDAAVADVETPDDRTRIEFHGEQIAVRELASYLYLKFCKAASRGVGTSDLEGNAVMYDVINDVILPESRETFERIVVDQRLNPDELFAFVRMVIEKVTARPTVPPSSLELSASDGSPKSKSDLRVIDLGDGRIVEIQPGETAAAATARAMRMELDETPEAMVAVELFE